MWKLWKICGNFAKKEPPPFGSGHCLLKKEYPGIEAIKDIEMGKMRKAIERLEKLIEKNKEFAPCACKAVYMTRPDMDAIKTALDALKDKSE